MEAKIVSSISVRSEDGKHKRLCDLGFDLNGSLYIIDVENDRSGKQKYIACLDEYIRDLGMMMKKKIAM